MKTEKPSNGTRKPLAAAAAALILLVPFGYSVAKYVFAATAEESPQPFLERPDEKYERCLEDTEYMRYNHMEFIKELRDAGVRGGARREISFSSCRECHTSRKRFCTRCHDAVNMDPDCFECHDYE